MDSYDTSRRRPRRGLPSAKDAASAPDLFGAGAKASVTEPRARSTDRATSHTAAERAALGDLSATQARVRDLIRAHVVRIGVGVTDDQLVIEFKSFALANSHDEYGKVRCPSPQRIRTARADLVRLGYVRDSGQLAPSELGNPSTAWETVPQP